MDQSLGIFSKTFTKAFQAQRNFKKPVSPLPRTLRKMIRMRHMSLAAVLCLYVSSAAPHAVAQTNVQKNGRSTALPSETTTPLPNAPSAAAPAPARPALAGPAPAIAATNISYQTYKPAQAKGFTFGTLISNYLKSAISPRNFIEGGLVGGIPHLTKAPTQPIPPAVLNSATGTAFENAMSNYGDGMDTWRRGNEVELRYRGRRAAVGLATAETRDFFSNLALPVILRQDPRYLPADLSLPFGARMAHAVSSVFVTRTRGGHIIPNFSELGGTFGAAAMGEYFYADKFDAPELHTGQFLMRDAGFSLAADIATNFTRELVRSAIKPDLLRVSNEGEATDSNYYPLTVAGKAANWAKTTYSPRHFISAGLMAGIPKITTEPTYPVAPPINTTAEQLAYDQSLIAYGNQEQAWRQGLEQNLRYDARRALGGFSESETQGFLTNFLLPAVFRQEGRYIPRTDGGFGKRVGHAFTSLVVTRTNSGARVVNLSLLAGTTGAAYIAQQVYYPMLGVDGLEKNTVLGKTIGFNLAGDLLLNLFHEFKPQHSF